MAGGLCACIAELLPKGVAPAEYAVAAEEEGLMFVEIVLQEGKKHDVTSPLADRAML